MAARARVSRRSAESARSLLLRLWPHRTKSILHRTCARRVEFRSMCVLGEPRCRLGDENEAVLDRAVSRLVQASVSRSKHLQIVQQLAEDAEQRRIPQLVRPERRSSLWNGLPSNAERAEIERFGPTPSFLVGNKSTSRHLVGS